ncbi:MAG: S-layer homology domain-containing protein [Selenomonadaceae bacterium]
MKKTLISALTTAIVVGAASTTFAAANPFSDVPSDSWAYDAVSQLAQDGVVEGYGDGTFRGQTTITRYEMAQMVAKAMAKSDVSKADKAIIDKLAAEFADELNNLGVRVSNLEKKVDNVKFTGELRYRYTSTRHDSNMHGQNSKDNTNQVLFRLEPTAQINEHWAAKARIDYTTDMDSSKNNNNSTVDRAYAEGNYKNLNIKLGKLPYYSNQGLIIDERVSGGQITFGKDFKTTLTVGRYNFDNEYTGLNYTPWSDGSGASSTASYQALAFSYDAGKKFSAALEYHHLKGVGRDTNIFNTGKAYGADTANIWELGFGYKFTPTFKMDLAYAKNTQGNLDGKFNKAYNIALNYKGATPANKGSFGVFAAYRYLGQTATIAPTYDAIKDGQKGWEVGTSYTFAPNIVGTFKYFNGKDLKVDSDKDASRLFANLDFFF